MGVCLVAEKIEPKRWKIFNSCFALVLVEGRLLILLGLKKIKIYYLEILIVLFS